MTTPAEDYNSAVGRQLKGEIAAAGSSIARMARDIDVSRSALDNYTTGKRDIPIPVLYRVCAVIGVAPHVILERAQERFRTDASQGDAIITPLRPLTDVGGRRDNDAEVAFESELPHRRDTDDLYD
ncbi:helix-turn-helix transcriptional regulator [uncultured Microbacterium sp.]|uniref:helix-turn-helix domain-containing protein n=1 Tax=uncultured Microbacterium sp. TaxID=191216 RepID=UPI0028D60D88|nr:helix-turn-helix transcriptional regulator [uncultured Microbacterium sp.]